MNKKRIGIALFALALGGTTLVAVASPLAWFSQAPLVWSGTDFDEKFAFEIGGRPDGSAEALITPLRELSAEERPTEGFVRINDQSFKFGQRKNADGKAVLVCTVPAGTIPLDGTFDFEMVVKDNAGKPMLVRTFAYEAQ